MQQSLDGIQRQILVLVASYLGFLIADSRLVTEYSPEQRRRKCRLSYGVRVRHLTETCNNFSTLL
jgi:hypothetical protein